MQHMTFEQALQRSGDSSKNVLLGNGFSISGNPVFDYRMLLNRSQLDERLMSIFQGLNTADFEIVIEQLNNSAEIISLFDDANQSISADLRAAAQLLRKEFSERIVTEHAVHGVVFNEEFKGRISTGRRRNCLPFLRNFNKVFTTNYDLLLYWAIMFESEPGRDNDRQTMPTDDGFRSGGDEDTMVYAASSTQNVFYLHGSLFLQQRSITTRKIIRKGDNLLPIISENIKQDRMPLIILEGDTSSKLQRISEHAYLTNAIKKLSQLGGDLFIHGHSLSDNDQHIFNAINKSDEVRNIYVSAISGADESVALKDVDANEMRQRAIRQFPVSANREVYIYDGHTANIWGFNRR